MLSSGWSSSVEATLSGPEGSSWWSASVEAAMLASGGSSLVKATHSASGGRSSVETTMLTSGIPTHAAALPLPSKKALPEGSEQSLNVIQPCEV